VAGNCDVSKPDLSRAAVSLAGAVRSSRADEAIERSAILRWTAINPLWENVFRRGARRQPNRCRMQVPPCAGRGVVRGESAGARRSGRPAAVRPTRMRPTRRRRPGAGASAFVDHLRPTRANPATVGYTAPCITGAPQATRMLSPELTQPSSPPPSFMTTMITPDQIRRGRPWGGGALSAIKERRLLSSRSTTLCWRCRQGRCANCCCATTQLRPPAACVGSGAFDFSPNRIRGNYSPDARGVAVRLDDPFLVGYGVLTTRRRLPREAT